MAKKKNPFKPVYSPDYLHQYLIRDDEEARRQKPTSTTLLSGTNGDKVSKVIKGVPVEIDPARKSSRVLTTSDLYVPSFPAKGPILKDSDSRLSAAERIVDKFKKRVEVHTAKFKAETYVPPPTTGKKVWQTPLKYSGIFEYFHTGSKKLEYEKGVSGARLKRLHPDEIAVSYMKNILNRASNPNVKTIKLGGFEMTKDAARKIVLDEFTSALISLDKSKKSKFRLYSQEAKEFISAIYGSEKSIMASKGFSQLRGHYDIPEAERFTKGMEQYVSTDPKYITADSPREDVKPVEPSQARSRTGTILGMTRPDIDKKHQSDTKIENLIDMPKYKKELEDVITSQVDEASYKHSGYQVTKGIPSQSKTPITSDKEFKTGYQKKKISLSEKKERVIEIGELIREQQEDMDLDRSTSRLDIEIKTQFSGGPDSRILREGEIVSAKNIDISPQADAVRTAKVTEQDFLKEKYEITSKEYLAQRRKKKTEYKLTTKEIKKPEKSVKPVYAILGLNPNKTQEIAKRIIKSQYKKEQTGDAMLTILSGSDVEKGTKLVPPRNITKKNIILGTTENKPSLVTPSGGPQLEHDVVSETKKVELEQPNLKKVILPKGVKLGLATILTYPFLDVLFKPFEIAHAYETKIKPTQKSDHKGGIFAKVTRKTSEQKFEGKRREVTPYDEFVDWRNWDILKPGPWAKERSRIARTGHRLGD